MTKWLRVCFIIAIIFFSFKKTLVFADENKSEDTFGKICAELSNGETDFKKYIGERVTFYFYGIEKDGSGYVKNNDGSVLVNDPKFNSSKRGSYGTKVLILHASFYPFGIDPLVDELTVTSKVKDINVAKKIIIIDRAIINNLVNKK